MKRLMHICDDCSSRVSIPRIATSRATKSRCLQCGSTRLIPCDDARETMAAGNAARQGVKSPDTSWAMGHMICPQCGQAVPTQDGEFCVRDQGMCLRCFEKSTGIRFIGGYCW